jgi:hypothetical protein
MGPRAFIALGFVGTDILAKDSYILAEVIEEHEHDLRDTVKLMASDKVDDKMNLSTKEFLVSSGMATVVDLIFKDSQKFGQYLLSVFLFTRKKDIENKMRQ